MHDLSYFLGKNFWGDDGSQNMLVYQPAFSTLQLNKDKGIDYVTSWKSKGVYSSILSPQHTTFLHSIKHCEYKIGKKMDKDPLVVEQNNYVTQIANTYIVYDLDTCSNNPIRNFALKNCLFGATSIVKKLIKKVSV